MNHCALQKAKLTVNCQYKIINSIFWPLQHKYYQLNGYKYTAYTKFCNTVEFL